MSFPKCIIWDGVTHQRGKDKGRILNIWLEIWDGTIKGEREKAVRIQNFSDGLLQPIVANSQAIAQNRCHDRKEVEKRAEAGKDRRTQVSGTSIKK